MTAPLQSRIEAVTVYRRGALVTRVADLAAGATRVRVTGLPLALDDGSVRVEVEGEHGTAPVATDVRVVLEAGEVDPTLQPPADEELREAQIEERRVVAELERRRRELGRLTQLRPAARPAPAEGEPPVAPPAEERLALGAFRLVESERLLDAIDALDARLREARERHADLAERARRATSARQAREHELRKTVLVGLHPDGTGRARLYLRYLVPGASWAPAYAVRLEHDLTACRLGLRALVRQRTGEDWTGVALTLSTAAPQRWVRLPELHALRIGRRQPPKARAGWRAPPRGADALYADYDRARAPAPAAERFPLDDRPTDEWAGDDAKTPTDAGTAQRAAAAARYAVDLDYPTAPRAPGREAAPPQRAPAPAARSALPPLRAASPAAPPAPPQLRAAPLAAIASAVPAKRAAPVPSLGEGPPRGGEGALFGMDEMPDPSEPEGEAPAGVRPRDALLDYPRLRMAGPGDAQRGRLVPASERRLLLELLVEQRVEIRLDVLELVRGSGREADEIASRPLPAGYRPPDPQDGFDYAYAADHPIDVPSDGAAHSVPLAERAGEARPRFVAVPRETQEVFRTVELVNPLDAPLLPGPADVYAGGDYLMTTDIRLTPARGRLTLGLGVEQALKVARNVRFEEQAAGLMRGALDLRHEIRIDLKSHLPHAATVEVRDRVPVARENDDDVRVSIDEVEPRWEPFEQDEQPLEGGHRWVVEVPPRGERALRAVYVVRIPSKLELAGGNRRDG